MNRKFKLVVLCAFYLVTGAAVAQASGDNEELKIAALEALMAAPPEKALPIVVKVMSSDNSDEVKSRALFVLSQIDDPQAHQILLDTATQTEGELQLEAIRMIGISGNDEGIAQLGGIYQSGNHELKEAVMHAYMIAGDEDSVLAIAQSASSDEEFDTAIHILGAMGATDHLKQLRDDPRATESLLQAYAIAGDTESLIVLAKDDSNREKQIQAIQAMGIAGGEEVNANLMGIYRSSSDQDIQQAALHGMLIADYDEGVLELYKASQDPQEKADLLRMLVMMDSDAAMDAIDEALSGEQE